MRGFPLLMAFIAWAAALASGTLLSVELAALADIFAFEWRPLGALLGPQGLAMMIAINAGLLASLGWAIATIRRRSLRRPRLLLGLLSVWLLLILWVLEWMFMERPLTVRLQGTQRTTQTLTLPPDAATDLARFSLARALPEPAAAHDLQVMYERVRIANPTALGRHALGATIDEYARRFDVDPAILFYLAYVHSFWGEATSGPVPFLGDMSSETIRDVVQIHLPAWFVEGRLRRQLASSDVLTRLVGESAGFKLRYALHKATLDVSAQPFELNLFSDVLLVLQEYPEQFSDVLGPSIDDPVRKALRDSFLRIRDSALLRPYEDPYAVAGVGPDYLRQHREDLKRFARAAYYATVLDFDLATRIAALLIVYQRDYYAGQLGSEAWSSLPDFQRAALLAMTRDVYVPNVGRFGYNPYALPELNCTPVRFVAEQARSGMPLGEAARAQLWRPKDHTKLWGGAGTKLRVFSEVWAATRGMPFPGLGPESSVPQSAEVVLRNVPR